MEQFGEEEEREQEYAEEVRYARNEAVVYAMKQGGRAGPKASGEASRLGPRDSARVEKNQLES